MLQYNNAEIFQTATRCKLLRMHLLAETEAADADDCYTDNHGCSSDNHHDNQHCKNTGQPHISLFQISCSAKPTRHI